MICCLLFPVNTAMLAQSSIGSLMDSLGSVHTWKERLVVFQHYLDESAKAKVDQRYIEVPDKPWRVILRQKANAVNVKYNNTLEALDPSVDAHVDWEMRFIPPVATSVDFWVGYRGASVSYSHSLVKNAGRYFTFSSTGAQYGFNFRYRRFNTSAVNFRMTTYDIDGNISDYEKDDDTPSPVWIRSTYVNGYYVFNGRRYSQDAAYNQSVVQRHSAGSFLAGATWYQSSFDYSDVANNVFMIIARGLGRIKVHQANLGLGYGYNWVPFRGFIFNAMVMPNISFYNRVKVYKYDSNYDLSDDDAPDDFGEWNPEMRKWANGETHRSLLYEKKDNPADAEVWETGTDTEYSWGKVNLDFRLGIAYNWKKYFMGFQAQFSDFHYDKGKCGVGMVDSFAQLALGVRL